MKKRWIAGGLAIVVSSFAASAVVASVRASVPIVCNRGPSNQRFDVAVTLPATVAPGATYTIRIDGTPSGRISHTGLNYIHDMRSDYLVPTGTTFIEGSERIIPDTGTENVRPTARISQAGGVVRLFLPGHVEDGSGYTPPSIEFSVKAASPPGTSLGLGFWRYRVTANAFLIGDVHVSCDPDPRPYTIGTSTVAAL